MHIRFTEEVIEVFALSKAPIGTLPEGWGKGSSKPVVPDWLQPHWPPHSVGNFLIEAGVVMILAIVIAVWFDHTFVRPRHNRNK